jgi:hypothetical protein
MSEDWIARLIGGAGVVIGIVSLGLTAFLWLRSGPVMKVTAFVRADHGTIQIGVANTGRITATVKRLELREQTVLQVHGGGSGTAAFSRWSVPVELNPDNTAVELGPTGYIEVEYPVAALLKKSTGSATVTVAAWAERGDGKWHSSAPIQLR